MAIQEAVAADLSHTAAFKSQSWPTPSRWMPTIDQVRGKVLLVEVPD